MLRDKEGKPYTWDDFRQHFSSLGQDETYALNEWNKAIPENPIPAAAEGNSNCFNYGKRKGVVAPDCVGHPNDPLFVKRSRTGNLGDVYCGPCTFRLRSGDPSGHWQAADIPDPPGQDPLPAAGSASSRP